MPHKNLPAAFKVISGTFLQ